ncbi:MAG: MazG nucleotide pyrophosphohydrolase domain-containing protein, partial [Oscillospiraceae bacterium]|nr:MazG nucleotide pyrophosphohydrolase domain-containing protein [Oscillospiraceae bacterium]
MIDFERKEHYGLSDLLRIVALLRSEDGCPWDRVQTHASLRRSLLEEAYEAAEAIDREDPALLKEELGDLLLQVVFHADIERRAGNFTMDDVADGEVRKMLFRHPHVFGGQETVQDADTVLEGWEAIKRREKGQQTTAQALDAVARS